MRKIHKRPPETNILVDDRTLIGDSNIPLSPLIPQLAFFVAL